VADDGVLLLEGPGDVRLALGETDEPIRLPSFMHFGFGGPEARDEVHAFRDRLAADGIEIVEFWEEPDYVSVKCRDPDGYVVEFAWEPA
jgi:catechol 2,3-dioxygenase-like lactoylglutathione lyase family enzyme